MTFAGAASCKRLGNKPAGRPADSEATLQAGLSPERPPEETPTGGTPTGGTPTGVTPTGETPTGERPAKNSPSRETSAREAPINKTPTKDDDRLLTDPRQDRKERPKDDGGEVGAHRVDMPPPAPLEVASLGAEPRHSLRYLFNAGDTLVWEAEVAQRTELRSEKICPPLNAPQGSLSRPEQTIPLGYKVRVLSQVTSAPRDRFTLRTRFDRVRLTLPPSLTDQRSLMESLVGNTSYTVTVNRRGRVESFVLGKLTGVSAKHLLDRMRSPLGVVQPVLPDPAVGVGATWRYVHRLALPQPGGQVNAVYASMYQLSKLRGEGRDALATIQVSTTINLEGKVMGEEYSGRGLGTSRLELDVATGLVRTIEGEMKICTVVLGRSSTNYTRFGQTYQASESVKGPAPSTQNKPGRGGNPR